MTEDSMHVKPDCDFEFSLPHGIDDEDGASFTEAPAAAATNSNTMEDRSCGGRGTSDLFDDNDNAHPTTEYVLPPGFSDDEGGDEAFDRSWTGHQARKAMPKQKKPPRHSEDGDSDDEAIPRAKKPRKSLFGGGPVEHVEEEAEHNVEDDLPEDIQVQVMEDRADEFEDDISSFSAHRLDIRQRMSSLNLDLQEEPDNRLFKLSFGIATSDKDEHSPAPSRAASEESVAIPKEDVYDLRRNIDRSRPVTYLDSDKTGNYDPAQEARLKMLRLQKAKAAKAAKKKGKGKGKAKAPKEHVLKCIVNLRFKSFGNVRNITDDFEHWPEDWSDVDSDYEEDTKAIREFYRRNTPETDETKPRVAIEDPKGAVDDLTGHPAARGCKHCRVEGHDCTMIEGGPYPCEQCEDDEIDCIPCMTPIVKGGCIQCVEGGQDKCSFEDDQEPIDCDHCTEHEYTCEPLPPRGYKTPRQSIDDAMYSEKRKHIQCTFCRIEKKRCSLKKKTDKPPCKFCKRNGIGCTFYDTPKLESTKKNAGKQKAKLGPTEGDAPEVSKPGSDYFSPEDLEDMNRDADDQLSREVTPEIEMEDDAGNKGPLTKIRTSFAHPVQFNTDARDCSFCELPVFGFFGHFEREVHVIEWYNGLGYTETGGGWAEEHSATTMCETCTATRIQIMVCPSHEFQSIEEDGGTPDAELLTDLLASTEPASLDMRTQLQRWCSLCFTPATYGCSLTQPSVVTDKDIVGCCLRLCHTCFEKLRDTHLWNLQEMVIVMEANMSKVTEEDTAAADLDGKLRADVGFLRTDGLLMRCLNGAGDGEAEI